MIDPVIFSFQLFGIQIALHWYGVLAMTGLLAGAIIAARGIQQRGGDGEKMWDVLVWLAFAGVLGARLWYVLNHILGGGTYYLEQPIRILAINEGGLHLYGAVLAGGLAAYLYFRKIGFDFLLFLDSVAPGLLVGQAIGRIANFINQELYGQPTDLPWGIPISAGHRIAPWNDMATYPEESTRFHPTFAYEAIWNLIGAGLMLWLGKRFAKQLKPGVMFGVWMVWAGLGRFWVEVFRPDQPRIPGTDLSYSRLFAGLFALAGMLYILARNGKIKIPFVSTKPDKYKV
ncbi:MAG: prolipoprotein diacylglyceryl transferase [Anaerolineales bacterium]|nr:prolipoprotein diacylglyceryl transferase [Anaerolineales bacterium]